MSECKCEKWEKYPGGMGVPGGVDLPKWSVDIVDFRNKKINQDYINNGYKYTDEMEKEYKDIDSSIYEMMNFVLKNKLCKI